MADKGARISSDELRKAAAETESELLALLKAEQLSLFGGDPHHVGYTRTNKRGTVSNIAAKNPRAKENEAVPNRHALQRNIEQLAAEKGMDPIALISQLQTGATASGRHKLVGLLGAIKGRYIRKQQKEQPVKVYSQTDKETGKQTYHNWDTAEEIPDYEGEYTSYHSGTGQQMHTWKDETGERAFSAMPKEEWYAKHGSGEVHQQHLAEHAAAIEREYDHNGVEAYGQKGMKNTVWRKLFKDADELHAWTEKNDASVLGTRGLTDFEAHPKSKGGKEQLAAMRKKPPVAKTPAASHLTGEAYWKESHKKIESALSGMNLPGVKTKVRRNENMVTVSIRPTDDVPGGATLVAHGQETMSGQQHRRNKEMVSSAAKAIEQRLKGTGINIEDIAAEENSVFLVLHNTQKVAKSLREEITSATMLLKSHVKAYQRTTASGASVTVKEHDDSRQKHPSPWNAHHAAVHKLGVAMEAGGNSEDGYHIQVAAKHMKNGDKKAFTQHMEGSGNFMYEQVLPHIHPDHWKELGGNPIDKERSTKEFEKRHPVKGGAGKNAHKLGSKMTQAYDRFHKEDTKTEKKFNKLNSKLTR